MAWACCLFPNFPTTSHGIAPMADPSWYTGHCAPVLCVGILVRVSYWRHQTMALRPWFHQLTHRTRLRSPHACVGRGVGHTRPRAVAATGCTPHMSWGPCVYARVASCVLGTPKVVPWCPFGAVKASLGAPSFESPIPSPLKE